VGYHENLKNLGFELYDELYDYAFDAEPDWKTRTEMVVKQIHSTQGANYQELYAQVLPKLEHNLARWIHFVVHDRPVPDIVSEHPEFFQNYVLRDQDAVNCLIHHDYFKKYV
jgi:hypothetical protein